MVRARLSLFLRASNAFITIFLLAGADMNETIDDHYIVLVAVILPRHIVHSSLYNLVCFEQLIIRHNCFSAL